MTAPRPTTGDLRSALAECLFRSGGSAGIRALDRRFSEFHSSFPIEELRVTFDDGRVELLLFKDVSPAAMFAEARAAKPAFVRNPLREIELYRGTLAKAELGTPYCYGSLVDPDRGRYWLFLEKVPGLELYRVGREGWEATASWLGRMHADLAPRIASEPAPLLRHDRGHYERWIVRALRFVDGDRDARLRLEALADGYERVVDRVLALPRTLVHGEFYASNVLFAENGEETRVCPVDWETAAVGPGLIDLAALTAGEWTRDDVARFAAVYREAAGSLYDPALTEDDFMRSLAACRVCLAVQWLGWSRTWSPPEEHRQDWLEEAVCQAESL